MSLKELEKVMLPEVYVISYPKSGRTWLRVLVGKALSDQYSLPEEKILETEVMTINPSIPCTSFTHDGWDMKNRRKWNEMPTDRSKYKNNKIILLGRNVKDTLVSAYFQATKRIMVFDGSMSEFLRSEHFGVMKLLKFYEIWWNARSIPKEI